jgi:prepilin signal peptidase PulO-like enzyme (type II secretory pathway)
VKTGILLLLGLLIGTLLTWLSDRLLDETPPLFARFARTVLFGRQGAPREPLPVRYPLGIAGFAIAFVATCLRFGLTPDGAVGLTLLALLYVILQTDLAEMIIPNEVVIVGVAGFLLLRLLHHPLPFWNYAAAAVGASGFLLAVGLLVEKWLGKEAMGGGDIKLYLVIGLALGGKLALFSLFLASFLGLAVMLPWQLHTGKKDTGAPVPFGPFIALGAWLSCLWGTAWIEAYLRLLS